MHLLQGSGLSSPWPPALSSPLQAYIHEVTHCTIWPTLNGLQSKHCKPLSHPPPPCLSWLTCCSTPLHTGLQIHRHSHFFTIHHPYFVFNFFTSLYSISRHCNHSLYILCPQDFNHIFLENPLDMFKQIQLHLDLTNWTIPEKTTWPYKLISLQICCQNPEQTLHSDRWAYKTFLANLLSYWKKTIISLSITCPFSKTSFIPHSQLPLTSWRKQMKWDEYHIIFWSPLPATFLNPF